MMDVRALICTEVGTRRLKWHSYKKIYTAAQPETLGAEIILEVCNEGVFHALTHLRGVCWVGELSGDVECEPRQHVHLLVSNLHLRGQQGGAQPQ